jgi:Tfp pilus assembly protein PilN
MADINLIPQEVKKEQAKKQVVKSSTYVSVFLLVVVGAVSAFLFFRTVSVKSQIKSTNGHIEELRSQINSMSRIEITARNLDQRYSTIKSVFDSRARYSLLMTEFKKRIPETIKVDTFGTGKDNTLNVSGSGADYISIAQFVNNLADKKFPGAKSGYEDIFSEVALNSVNLDAQTSKARFFIVITLDGGVLSK